MAEKERCLNYRIVNRRPLTVSGIASDPSRAESIPDKEVMQIDIEWTHTEGFPEDTRTIAFPTKTVRAVAHYLLAHLAKEGMVDSAQVKKLEGEVGKVFRLHPSDPNLSTITVPDGQREIIHDQMNVIASTPDSMVMQLLEERRPHLAKALGIKP
jgi:hypothetical protein